MHKCGTISGHTHLLSDACDMRRNLVLVIAELAVQQKGWGSHAHNAAHSWWPISSFSHHAPLWYADVERLVLKRQLRQTCRFDFIKQVPLLFPSYAMHTFDIRVFSPACICSLICFIVCNKQVIPLVCFPHATTFVLP